MVRNDATVIKVKHDILCEVAKLAFAGELEKKKDELPYKISPGPSARFRCCVYREREVIRQRIRLAEGKNPDDRISSNIVQVITAACEGCPISRYIVTDNCQNCMGKACMNSCNFGAISAGRTRTYIDPTKCKECGKCSKACPYNAIADLVRPCKRNCPVDAVKMDENGICQIDETKCIQCGQCIHSCPFGAIGSKSSIVDIINDMRAGKRIVGMLAPAWEGQFGNNITIRSWKNALKKIGFDDLYEVGLGADMTAAFEAKEWSEAYKEGKKKTTSCCPAFVNMVKLHFPTLLDAVSTTISPMWALSRMLKNLDPDVKVVFIGPCIAKKSEAKDCKPEDGNADYVLTFGEIRAMMRAKGVELEPANNDVQEASVFGKRFGNSGGVTAAVLQSMKESGVEDEINVLKCNGATECKKALLLMKAGKLPEDFIEGMVCEGGCVGGPSSHMPELASKRSRDTLIGQADDRTISDNLKNYDLDKFSMHRE